MFSFAILIGIYSYTVFALGVAGLLLKQNLILLTVFFSLFLFFYYRKIILSIYPLFSKKIGERLNKKVELGLVLIIFLQTLVNLIGALGPELAFDSLWYHLTLPKLYLVSHAIIHIPGGLLYYSDMPKLTELLYVVALIFQGEILAKLIHFTFGILSVIALYKLSRKLFSSKISLVAALIFYSNLVVGWESIAAYVDLTRTFFEIMVLWGFINWWENGRKRWLIESAVMLGLAITTKILAVSSLFIFSTLFIWHFLKNKSLPQSLIFNVFAFWFFALLIPLPWFIFSFIHTGNPIYPFFTNVYKIGFDASLINPLRFLSDIGNLFMRSPDPVSPIYIMSFPLIALLYKGFKNEMKIIAVYSILAIFIWYLTPQTGGGRFILPYLPAFSVLVAGVINILKDKWINLSLIMLIILVSFISITYRGIANSKYLPVLLGKQTKQEFLTQNLNFSFGDFYDTDNYFKRNIKQEDVVLLYGFHNLYYVDFPFIDSSWIKKGDKFNFIAVQKASLPQRFSYWKLIYYNNKTDVRLYSLGGQMWVY